ncbi:MAG: hypothetical protein HZB40_21430 [Rhodocyclales bacterium]|nr:hypothetical protein [Rhodocyclales bacterium]
MIAAARRLARLDGRVQRLYSRRTLDALRAALPMRLALPHLEPVLVLNVGKEVEKDTAVILDAGNPARAGIDREQRLSELLQATRDIDRRFLDQVGRFPVEIIVRYDEIIPFRTRRIRLMHEAAQKILGAGGEAVRLRQTLGSTYSREDFARLQYELFRLYAEEVRSLSRSVRLPKALVPLREMIARELLDVMLRVAWPLAQDIATLACRRPVPGAPGAD